MYPLSSQNKESPTVGESDIGKILIIPYIHYFIDTSFNEESMGVVDNRIRVPQNIKQIFENNHSGIPTN